MTKRTAGVLVVPVAIAGLIASARLLRAAPQATHLDTQKLVMENALVRVWEIVVPPGAHEPRHQHARGLTIALSDYDNETVAYPDRKVNRGHTRFGDVRWVEPQDHEATNTGTTEQHVIRVELK